MLGSKTGEDTFPAVVSGIFVAAALFLEVAWTGLMILSGKLKCVMILC